MPRERILPIFIPHLGCPFLCRYCDQRSVTARESAPTPEQVTEQIEKGLESTGGKAELAFYGGSFTMISPALRRAYLRAAAPFLAEGKITGIRLSTRPDGISPEILKELSESGVVRIELGAQSMDDRVLALSGRGHSARDTEKASEEIHRAGIALGLQMMTGLPGDTPAGAMETARRLADLHPSTMRIYPTLALPGTPLWEDWKAGKYTPQTLEEAVELTARLQTFFEEKQIAVIRTGLHTDEGLEKGAVGPYHPSFGELAASRRMAHRILTSLAGVDCSGKNLVIFVPRRSLSVAVGQKKSNQEYLRNALDASSLIFRGEDSGLLWEGYRVVVS